MRDYELVVLLATNGKTDSEHVLEEVKKLVAERGSVKRTQEWGVKPLAYPIAKQTQAAYVFLELSLSPHVVAELERTLKIHEGVLRHLLLRQEGKRAEVVEKKVTRAKETIESTVKTVKQSLSTIRKPRKKSTKKTKRSK